MLMKLIASILLFSAMSVNALEPFPQSINPLLQDSDRVDDYRLALGALEKVNSRWYSENEQRVSGDWQRVVYEVDRTHSSKEIFDFFHGQLIQQNSRQLFACEGRNCGPSSSWSANIFEVKQLYGLDQHQYYAVYEKLRVDGGADYWVVYSVTRGNQRNYTLIDHLSANQSIQSAIDFDTAVAQLKRGEAIELFWTVRESRVELSDVSYVADILKVFKRNTFAVLVYDFDADSSEASLENSVAIANEVRQAMVKGGIDEQQLITSGVGDLVRNKRVADQPYRLELVKLN